MTIGLRMLTGALFCSTLYAQWDIPTDNLSLPVLISFKNNSSDYGSGFLASDSLSLYLVTAKHVLFTMPQNTLKGDTIEVLKYSITDSGETRFRFKASLKNLLLDKNLRFHKTQDIAVALFARKQSRDDRKVGLKFKPGIQIIEKGEAPIIATDMGYFKRISDVLISNEVIIFGFPRSLGIKDIPQIEYDKPLLRKGIVAGINRSKGTIILDCPAYPGNSGGPVLQIDKVDFRKTSFRVIGIISEYVPFAQLQKSPQGQTNINVSNSGYSVVTPIDAFLDMLAE